MIKVFYLLSIISLAACSVSPKPTQQSRKSAIQEENGIMVIDSSFNLRYAFGKYNIENFITIGDEMVVFDKHSSLLISIHTKHADNKKDTIERVYYFDNNKHRLSHFYTQKNNHLYGLAVFYNSKGDVERCQYYDEEQVKNLSSIPTLPDRNSSETILNDSINSISFIQKDRSISTDNTVSYYKIKGKGILFIGTLCFVINKSGNLEAVYTQCNKRNNKLNRCGEGYYFDSQNRFLSTLRNYKDGLLDGKILYFNENGGVVKRETYRYGKKE